MNYISINFFFVLLDSNFFKLSSILKDQTFIVYEFYLFYYILNSLMGHSTYILYTTE